MDGESVLDLFSGMTVLQAREFRKQIFPTLRKLRETVISTVGTEPKQDEPKRKRVAATRKGKKSTLTNGCDRQN